MEFEAAVAAATDDPARTRRRDPTLQNTWGGESTPCVVLRSGAGHPDPSPKSTELVLFVQRAARMVTSST
jgi:hypothetical protein